MSRPRKLPENRKRHVKVVRLNDAMLEKLAGAASVNQRSMSEEIEYRLLASFDRDTLLAAWRAGYDFAQTTSGA